MIDGLRATRRQHINDLFVHTLTSCTCPGLQYSLNLRELSCHHRVDNLVEVESLRDLGMLGHLVERDFHDLQLTVNPRDLSLHQHRHIDNLVDVINLWELGVLGHLVDRRSVCAYAPRCARGVCPSPRCAPRTLPASRGWPTALPTYVHARDCTRARRGRAAASTLHHSDTDPS